MIPVWSSVTGVLSEEPLMTLPTSTDFSFSVSLNENQLARSCAFAVALRNQDSTVFLSSPVYPSPASSSVSSGLPRSFVSGENPEKVFASGAGGTVVDVPLDRLVLSSASGNAKLTTWGDTYIYLDRTFLSELESLTDFYSSCGLRFISVYAFRRMISSPPRRERTPPAIRSMFRPKRTRIFSVPRLTFCQSISLRRDL